MDGLYVVAKCKKYLGITHGWLYVEFVYKHRGVGDCELVTIAHYSLSIYIYDFIIINLIFYIHTMFFAVVFVL